SFGPVTIDWGDGETSAGTVEQPVAGGNFTVGGAHTYHNLGTYDISISVQENNGESTTLSATANVMPPVLTIPPTGINFTGNPTTATVVAPLTDAQGNPVAGVSIDGWTPAANNWPQAWLSVDWAP